MKRCLHLAVILVFTLNLTCLSFAQLETEETGPSIHLKPVLGFEFFSRTVGWNGDNENNYTSKLKSYLFTLKMEFEIQEGLFLDLLLGYSSSNYDEMVFRELPFSVELDVGGISGYLFGGEIQKNLISPGNFKIGLFGQFAFCLGTKKEWDISGLNVPGKIEGNPTWMRAVAGPLLTYQRFNDFYPYLFLSFNYLWGSFEMEETVQTLKGNEKKKFSGEGLIGISLGTIYELTDSFSLKGEVIVFPYKGGLDDFGFIINAAYAF
jgi:hypothetical protein